MAGSYLGYYVGYVKPSIDRSRIIGYMVREYTRNGFVSVQFDNGSNDNLLVYSSISSDHVLVRVFYV